MMIPSQGVSLSTAVKKEKRFAIFNLADYLWDPDKVDTFLITQKYLVQQREAAVEKIKIIESEQDGFVTTRLILDMEETLSDGSVSNVEVDLTPCEWMKLQENLDPRAIEIRKVRRVFTWSGRIYTFDVFVQPEIDWSLLIVDCDEDESEVPIPDFLVDGNSTVKDITGKGLWTTRHLSLLKTAGWNSESVRSFYY